MPDFRHIPLCVVLYYIPLNSATLDGDVATNKKPKSQDMRLNKLTLRNFKGVENFTFNPNGKSAEIKGANETGKTTVADALTWLLFDKDTAGASPEAFGIKTRESGKVVHGRNHEVVGEFKDPAVKLQKSYKEKWTKKTGHAHKELTGHTTEYHIDDIPVKKKEFEEKVGEIMNEDLFRMLTVPSYFPESLHWEKRRNILFEMSENVTVADAEGFDPSLDGIEKILDGKNPHERKKNLAERRKQLNDELDDLPVRIDEASQQITEPEVSKVEAEKQIKNIDEKISQLKQKQQDLQSGGQASELRVKIQELEAQISELRNEHKKKFETSIADAENRKREASRKYAELTSDKNDLDYKLDDSERELERNREKLEEAKSELEEAEKNPESTECPYCGKPMEQDKSERAEKLKEAKDKVSSLENAVSEKQKEYDSIKERSKIEDEKVKQAKVEYDEAVKAYDKAFEEFPDIEETKDYNRLVEQKEKLEAELANTKSSQDEKAKQLSGAIAEAEEEKKPYTEAINAYQYAEKANDRIKELQKRQKTVAKELEHVETCLHKVQNFIRAQAALIEKSVNKKFKKVRFSLFRELINGEMREVCEPYYKGIPYSGGLNNAGRVQAGLDIIEALSKHYGVEAPVIIDNRESITEIPKTKLQVISLVVSSEHDKLTVEVSK